jgi:hypothetical protein
VGQDWTETVGQDGGGINKRLVGCLQLLDGGIGQSHEDTPDEAAGEKYPQRFA